MLFGLGFVLAAATYLWARHVAMPSAVAWKWAVFVFCTGVPGLITFRLGATWPTRVPCPKCTHKRPIISEACPECRETWPVPESNGTEIFQPVGH